MTLHCIHGLWTKRCGRSTLSPTPRSRTYHRPYYAFHRARRQHGGIAASSSISHSENDSAWSRSCVRESSVKIKTNGSEQHCIKSHPLSSIRDPPSFGIAEGELRCELLRLLGLLFVFSSSALMFQPRYVLVRCQSSPRYQATERCLPARSSAPLRIRHFAATCTASR